MKFPPSMSTYPLFWTFLRETHCIYLLFLPLLTPLLCFLPTKITRLPPAHPAVLEQIPAFQGVFATTFFLVSLIPYLMTDYQV